MARPRKHPTEDARRQAHAAAQASYRARQAERISVGRAALEELVAALDAAAAAGDELAKKVRTGDTDGLLRNLGRHFRQVAGGDL